MIVFQSFWLSAVRWLGAGGDFAGFMFGSYFFLRNSRPRTREGPTRSTDRFPWRLRSAPIPLITNHLLSAPVSCRPRFEQWSGQRVIRLRRPGQDQVGASLKHALVALWVGRHDARAFQVVGRIPLPRSLTVGHVYLLHTFVPSPHLSPPFSLVGLKVDCP